MSDGGEIKNIHENIVNMFEQIFLGLLRLNRKPKDYFSVSKEEEVLNLSSFMDGKDYQCSTQQDIHKAMSEIVSQKNHYDNLVESITFQNTPEVRREEFFTPQMYNDLGKQNSVIIKNTESIHITPVKNETGKLTDEKATLLRLKQKASLDYHQIILHPFSADEKEWKVTLIKDERTYSTRYARPEALEKNLQEWTGLNENERIQTKFDENEINKEQLKQVGLKWNNLSEVQKRDLLSGKETSAVTITVKNEKGKKTYRRGHLQLQRTNAKTTDFLFRKAPTQSLKMKRFNY